LLQRQKGLEHPLDITHRSLIVAVGIGIGMLAMDRCHGIVPEPPGRAFPPPTIRAAEHVQSRPHAGRAETIVERFGANWQQIWRWDAKARHAADSRVGAFWPFQPRR
jgi:hypothetical protein